VSVAEGAASSKSGIHRPESPWLSMSIARNILLTTGKGCVEYTADTLARESATMEFVLAWSR
jgi:hypothetical protein